MGVACARAGAGGTATKPKEGGGIAVGAACRVAICFLRSARRNRHCLATRDGGTPAVNATAGAQRSGGIGRWGGGRVWRQWAHWPASWSSWCSACNGVSIFIFTSTSSGCLHTDDCRPWKIKIHAGSSEADGVGARRGHHGAAAVTSSLPRPHWRGIASPCWSPWRMGIERCQRRMDGGSAGGRSRACSGPRGR